MVATLEMKVCDILVKHYNIIQYYSIYLFILMRDYFFSSLKSLIYLCLRANNIRTEGARHLGEALQHNKVPFH